MKTAYFDCLRGASGILFLSSLVDAGADLSAIEKSLQGTALGKIKLQALRGRKGEFRGTHVQVSAPAGPSERSLKEILVILREAKIKKSVRAKALAVYRLLGEAESKVHGESQRHIHFHELGQARSIAGVLGTLTALENLGVRRIRSSRLALGEGWIRTAHGELPSPAPATLELLKGVPLKGAKRAGEIVTPTGAALIRALVSVFGPPSEFNIESSGYGKDGAVGRWVRVLIGEER